MIDKPCGRKGHVYWDFGGGKFGNKCLDCGTTIYRNSEGSAMVLLIQLGDGFVLELSRDPKTGVIVTKVRDGNGVFFGIGQILASEEKMFFGFSGWLL